MDLLVEIGTEELPPKALLSLSEAFTQGIQQGFNDAGLSAEAFTSYAAPRRLAVWVKGIADKQPDQIIEKRGPALQAAFDKEGKPSKAAEGFARSCGVAFEQLEHLETDKGSWLIFKQHQAGQQTKDLFPAIVDKSLAGLPIPKRMRWGAGTAEFVRPIHWIVMLADSEVIPAELLSTKTGNQSRGHRFHHPDLVTITSPSTYAEQLKAAYVWADFAERRANISRQVLAIAQSFGAKAIMPESLLDEVTALVEYPNAIVGKFEERFLSVPQEALIDTMQGNQKYFGLTDDNGKLLPSFITISNIKSSNPDSVSRGNERVIRPRFTDAAFFWEQDKKHKLESRRDKLKTVVFQQQLGTLLDKSTRVAQLSKVIAQQLGADSQLAVRAAELGKCDLMTNMVFEFTDLQGIMGTYYARLDGEAEEVALALNEQYQPRFAGDVLPSTQTGRILALAERIDTLVGIFAIGQKPTGTKDPFSLRRAAVGLLRIIIEQRLPLDLVQLLDGAAENLTSTLGKKPNIDEVRDYIFERLRAYYQEQGINAELVESVAALKPSQPLDFDHRVKAVAAFKGLPEADSLAAANKRISNILRKVETAIPATVNTELLKEPAEQALFKAVSEQQQIVQPLFAKGDYEQALTSLAALRAPVDQFFDDVMVMDENAQLRDNRLALLNQLRGLFLQVADLSVL
jgi:glycyl-tRNA synthetase beta chain